MGTIPNRSLIKFIEDITQNILSNINTESYFTLTADKKNRLLYSVFLMIKTSSNKSIVLKDGDLKNIINILLKKNVENENYEFAAILKDIFNNFESMEELLKEVPSPVKRTRKTSKPKEKDQ